MAMLLYDEDMIDDGSRDTGRLLHILLSIRSTELQVEFASGFVPTDIDVGCHLSSVRFLMVRLTTHLSLISTDVKTSMLLHPYIKAH